MSAQAAAPSLDQVRPLAYAALLDHARRRDPAHALAMRLQPLASLVAAELLAMIGDLLDLSFAEAAHLPIQLQGVPLARCSTPARRGADRRRTAGASRCASRIRTPVRR